MYHKGMGVCTESVVTMVCKKNRILV